MFRFWLSLRLTFAIFRWIVAHCRGSVGRFKIHYHICRKSNLASTRLEWKIEISRHTMTSLPCNKQASYSNWIKTVNKCFFKLKKSTKDSYTKTSEAEELGLSLLRALVREKKVLRRRIEVTFSDSENRRECSPDREQCLICHLKAFRKSSLNKAYIRGLAELLQTKNKMQILKNRSKYSNCEVSWKMSTTRNTLYGSNVTKKTSTTGVRTLSALWFLSLAHLVLSGVDEAGLRDSRRIWLCKAMLSFRRLRMLRYVKRIIPRGKRYVSKTVSAW